LVSWLVCLLVSWLVCWLVGWLVCWLVGWLVGCFVGWLVGWLVSWLVSYEGTNITLPMPAAARFKAWVCCHSLAGIAGSNPAKGMDVCLL
jgi:hypothetical protein